LLEAAELAEMLFPEAGEIWLASRTPTAPDLFPV
jgi:hypothetical protein